MSPARVGGIAGIAGWVLFFIAFVLDPTPPTVGTPAAEIVEHYATHQHVMIAAAFLFGAASPLFLVWGAAVARLMRDHEGDQGWLWLAFISANSAGWAINIVASYMWLAGVVRSRAGSLGPLGPVVELNSDLIQLGYTFAGFASVVLVPTASLVMVRTGMVSRRLGQVGFAVTALQVVYLATALFTTGPMAGGGVVMITGFTGLGLWFLAVSVGMLANAPKAAPLRS